MRVAEERHTRCERGVGEGQRRGERQDDGCERGDTGRCGGRGCGGVVEPGGRGRCLYVSSLRPTPANAPARRCSRVSGLPALRRASMTRARGRRAAPLSVRGTHHAPSAPAGEPKPS